MKKHSILLIASLIFANILQAQVEIDPIADINGDRFHNYFDPFLYTPDKKLSIEHNSESFELGYYYDYDGNKTEGLIKYHNKKIFFKKDKDAFHHEVLRTKVVKSVVIGVDSFFAATNIQLKHTIKTKPEFLQFITELNGKVYAKHYKFPSALSNTATIVDTYLVKSPDSQMWLNFTGNRNFKKNALKHFGHIKIIKERIVSGVYKSKDILSVIKTAEYLDKYQNKEAIFYDKYWQETRSMDLKHYYANITDKKDSIWTLKYFKDSTLIYMAQYTSFYPNKKEGSFIAFHPNGKVRKIINFEKNKPKTGQTFFENGLINRDFEYKIVKDDYSGTEKTHILYNQIYDEDGNKFLNENGDGTYDFTYKNTGLSYTHIYQERYLTEVFRMMGENKIYQPINEENRIKMKSLPRKLNNFMYDREYNIALSENAQGIILIHFLVDSKGIVLEHKILNKIHPELDEIAAKFLEEVLSSNEKKPHKFKPMLINKEKQFCEFILPLEFNIRRFYRNPINFYHFNHWHMHQMHQNMMPAVKIQTPSFPRGF